MVHTEPQGNQEGSMGKDQGVPPPGITGVMGDNHMEDNMDNMPLQAYQWFHTVDTDRSGFINLKELKQALVNSNWSAFNDETCLMMITLAQMGYNLSPQFSETLVRRFTLQGGRPGIQLDRFIQVCTQLQTMTQVFREKDTSMTGNIRLNYEDFLSGAVTRLM
ncbi:hypothetical protein FQN60_007671 [Etheostoma spectabile]|uniref:Peflin n=1 Tax=Etheostoma spectabile TaxID=54343 RepID=A0A5J5CUL6_9PERO|nr:hypothetical protein FQN60_007671 [Etheostoma spectabile]